MLNLKKKVKQAMKTDLEGTLERVSKQVIISRAW